MSKKSKVDTPYVGSWAHKLSTEEGRKELLQESIERAKSSPVIFHNLNIAWYAELMGCSHEKAREALGYPKPLATLSREQYRQMMGLALR